MASACGRSRRRADAVRFVQPRTGGLTGGIEFRGGGSGNEVRRAAGNRGWAEAAPALRGRPPTPSGKLFAVFPAATIPAPGLTPPEGQETSQHCTPYQEDQIPHFRPPQAAAGGRHSSRGRRAQVPFRQRSTYRLLSGLFLWHDNITG